MRRGLPYRRYVIQRIEELGAILGAKENRDNMPSLFGWVPNGDER